MPFDYLSAVQKQYTKETVSQDYIPSNGATKLQILWVGCSDSLVLETECLEGLREEMFVHRNLGALVSNGDLSTTSAVEWCVDLLKVCFAFVPCPSRRGNESAERKGGRGS